MRQGLTELEEKVECTAELTFFDLENRANHPQLQPVNPPTVEKLGDRLWQEFMPRVRGRPV